MVRISRKDFIQLIIFWRRALALPPFKWWRLGVPFLTTVHNTLLINIICELNFIMIFIGQEHSL